LSSYTHRSPRRSGPPEGGHYKWFSAAIIAVAVVAAYRTGLQTPFQYDDLSTVVENDSIKHLPDLRLALSPPPNSTPTSGRPLLNLSFAIDYAITDLNVIGYHITNIALHLVAALLLFAIVRRTLRLPSVGLESHADLIATVIAAIWAVHPIQIGAVTYISGRSDVLMAVCYFAVLGAAIQARPFDSAQGTHSPRASAWAVGAVVACALGMACKESMVTAPVAVVLYDRAYVYDGFGIALRQRWRLYAGLAATWAVLAFVLIDAPHSASAGFSTGISPWTYLLNQALIIPEYVRLVLWPDHLLFAFGEARLISAVDVGVMGLIAPSLAVAAIWLWLRRPAIGFPALWVFLTLSPTSSIVPIATEAGAARRMYLPLAGIVVLFAIGIVTIARRRHRRGASFAPRLFSSVATILVVVLAATTSAQNREFVSAEGLWRGSLEQWPSRLAHRNLAAVLLQEGRRSEAIEHLRAAADQGPLARYALGVALFDDGQTADAIVELQRAIGETPHDPTVALEGRRVLARALAQQQRHREAADVFGQIAALTPDDIAPRLSRADELLAAGDLPDAHEEYQRILAAQPHHSGAQTNDGLTLLRLGRVSEALPLLRSVAEREPRNANAFMNLASAAAAAGHVDEATAAVCHVLAEDPRHRPAQEFLAELRRAAASARVHLQDCPAR
jgi:tetratricopeptide (TPR) repeat protein